MTASPSACSACGGARELRAARLELGPEDATPVDVPHLLSVFDDARTARSPRLILSTRAPDLLRDLLTEAAPDTAWVEVHQSQLAQPGIETAARAARARSEERRVGKECRL